jgi:hypothetical protein
MNGQMREDLPNTKLNLYVKIDSRGFSKFKTSEEEAFTAIQSLYTHLSYIPVDDSIFLSNNIS